MTRAWRIVLWIAAVLLVLGAVFAGAGWLTGASVSRIVDLAFGGKDGLTAALSGAGRWLQLALDSLRSVF